MGKSLTEADVIALAAAMAGSGGGGTGDGDMKKSVYDSDNAVADAGGIKNYVQGVTPSDLKDLNDDTTHRTVSDTEKSTWNGKQDALTFDNTPTSGSDNPVKSGGIYSALADKANTSDLGSLAAKDNASASYTPQGSVTVDQGTDEKTTVNSISNVGTLPSYTLDGEKLIFNPGSLPTKGADTSVVTASGTRTASFAGTQASIVVS